MKIAFCYKGTFNINYIVKYGVDNVILSNLKSNIDNNFEKIFDVFQKLNYIYDIFVSTYDIHEDMTKIISSNLNPKNIFLFPPNYNTQSNGFTHLQQLIHLKKLTEMIILEEEKMNQEYDLLIFSRFDINMLKYFNELSINYESFNLTLKNEGGGCDDNFFIFPRNYLKHFIKSINNLYDENTIVHRLNHKLNDLDVKINYMEPLDTSIYMGHRMFEFVRCGSNPNDGFSIYSGYTR